MKLVMASSVMASGLPSSMASKEETAVLLQVGNKDKLHLQRQDASIGAATVQATRLLFDALQQNASRTELAMLMLNLPNSTQWDALADQLKSLMGNSLKAGHEADVAAAAQLSTEYTGCNTQFSSSQVALDSLLLTLQSQRVRHQTCRKEQKVLHDSKGTVCGEFTTFKETSWNSPTGIAIPGAGDQDCAVHSDLFSASAKLQAKDFIEGNEEFVQWQVDSWQQYLTHFQNCKQDTNAYDTKGGICAVQQGQLEVEACSVYTLKKTQCDTQTTCFGLLQASVDEDCPAMQTRVEARKEFCIQAEEMTCVLTNVFKSLSPTEGSIALAIEDCHGQQSHSQECEKYAIGCPASPTPPPPLCQPPARPGENAWWFLEMEPPNSHLYNGGQLSAEAVHVATAVLLACPEIGGHSPTECAANQVEVCGEHSTSNSQCMCVTCPSVKPFGSPSGCVVAAKCGSAAGIDNFCGEGKLFDQGKANFDCASGVCTAADVDTCCTAAPTTTTTLQLGADGCPVTLGADGCPAVGAKSYQVHKSADVGCITRHRDDCDYIFNYCKDGWHLGTQEEYTCWFAAGNVGPIHNGYGVTSTMCRVGAHANGDHYNGDHHWLTRESNTNPNGEHYGWHSRWCCDPSRFFLCVTETTEAAPSEPVD